MIIKIKIEYKTFYIINWEEIKKLLRYFRKVKK